MIQKRNTTGPQHINTLWCWYRPYFVSYALFNPSSSVISWSCLTNFRNRSAWRGRTSPASSWSSSSSRTSSRLGIYTVRVKKGWTERLNKKVYKSSWSSSSSRASSRLGVVKKVPCQWLEYVHIYIERERETLHNSSSSSSSSSGSSSSSFIIITTTTTTKYYYY